MDGREGGHLSLAICSIKVSALSSLPYTCRTRGRVWVRVRVGIRVRVRVGIGIRVGISVDGIGVIVLAWGLDGVC